ncbi:hypothetical protein PTKIN_Ptkin01aG0330100 [Pterospermum kingtungense]
MSATQTSIHDLESEILSMTLDTISLAISEQSIIELSTTINKASRHSGLIKEEVKVPRQSISDMVLVEENSGKIVTSQPNCYQGNPEGCQAILEDVDNGRHVMVEATHPTSDMVVMGESNGKNVTSQPKCHQGDPEHKAMQIATVSREDQEGQKKTRHQENLEILGRFLKLKQGGYEGVFFSTSIPSEEGEVEERVKKMAIRLAMVSLREWMLSGVNSLVKGDYCGAFEESSFKSVAKFILRVFDLEDIERVFSFDELAAEYKRFYDEILVPLKSDENPFRLVAERKIKFDRFPLLREPDIGCILDKYCDLKHCGLHLKDEIGFLVCLMRLGPDQYFKHCFKERCHGRFVEMARTVLLHYVPLQEDIKMHAILDYVVCSCGRTVNGFLHEAISDAVGKLTKEDPRDDKLTNEIYCKLSSITDGRSTMFLHCSFPVASFMEYGPSGRSSFRSFAREVSVLVCAADARRRFKDHRFISKDHILWAVGLTIYKEITDNLVKDSKLKNLAKEPAARHPPYSVYKLAQAIAGSRGEKPVGVEHIVVGIVYEMSEVEERMRDLAEFCRKLCVRKFFRAASRCKERNGGSSSFFLNIAAELAGDKKRKNPL